MKLLTQLREFALMMMENTSKVVTMNARNLNYIYPNNLRKYFPLADNKLKTKALLEKEGLATAKTYAIFTYFFELESLDGILKEHKEFVIKPAQGSGGNGILVIIGKEGDDFITAGKKHLSLEAIKKHIGDILFGVHSVGMNDVAILEERLLQHPRLEALSPDGLADIRVICYNKSPAMAMIRLATKASDGKANLHQGGIGVAVDMAEGKTVHAQIKRQDTTVHPDSGENLIGIVVPYWEEIKLLSTKVAQLVPLNYLGIDIALTPKGPMILEINVRPGIEIQNINNKGMKPALEELR